MRQKRVLTVQDLSCFGKSSITVALPVLSAFGVETVVLPTALLSTHTGGFTGYSYCDLTFEMDKILAHWKTIGLTFDGIYTGYLGTEALIDKVLKLIDDFAGEGVFVFVDPVLGDRGEPYAGFGKGYIEKYKALCQKAQMISPNVTEASLLSGIPYRDSRDEAYYRTLVKALLPLGVEKTVLTGAYAGAERVGCIGSDLRDGKHFSIYRKRIDAPLHGTGDAFSCALMGGIMNGLSFQKAVYLAAEFVSKAIDETEKEGEGYWYGLKFEPCLSEIPMLLAKYR